MLLCVAGDANNMRSEPRQFLVALAAAGLLFTASPALAAGPSDLSGAFGETAAAIEQFRAIEVGGILVLRGRTDDPSAAERAGQQAKALGYGRIANLIQLAPPVDDSAIQRRAERELAIHRSLDGCRFTIASHRGVVRIAGTVHHELQKDVAMHLVRNVDGVRAVQSELRRF